MPSPNITAERFAEYTLHSPEGDRTIVLADLVHTHLWERRAGRVVLDTLEVARQIEPHLQPRRRPNPYEENRSAKLAAHIGKHKGYVVAYEQPTDPDIAPAILAFGFMARIDPSEYALDQFGVTVDYDARELRPLDPTKEHSRNIRLLAGAALLYGLSNRLPGEAIVYVVPQPEGESRTGYLFEEAGFTPTDKVPWRKGGVLSAAASTVVDELPEISAYAFLRGPGHESDA